jgi:hypothetical protein
LKDERRTSNIQSRQGVKKQTSNTEDSKPISALLSHFDIRNENLKQFFCFLTFFHSIFDVGRSMFDVRFFQFSM